MRPAILVFATSWLACGGAAPSAPPGAGAGGEPSGSPAGAVDGGAAGATAGAASAVLERLDDGGDCAGVVPDGVPDPVSVRVAAPAGGACLGGTSDGTGAIAVGTRDGAGATTWHAFAADGTPRGAFAADAPLVPAPAGWQAIVSSGAPGAWDAQAALVAFAADGAAARREPVSPEPAIAGYARWSMGRDPAGGALVAVRSSAVAGNHWSSVTAHRCDADGAPRWPGGAKVRTLPSATEPMFLAGGVSRHGEALVVSQRSAFLDVSWLDAGTGAALAGATADEVEHAADVVGPGLSPALELVPLLDGGLALRADGALRRVYPRRSPASAPLPGWLAERALATVRFTRGNAGYAALPPPGQAAPDCTQRVDLLSPSGRLCGRVVLREDGAGCTTGAVDQGWDGTVVQQSGKDPCAYRAWPRLLGRR